jgi:hypothetical protein
MADITTVFIFHTTASSEDAESDAGFELILERQGGDLRLAFPDLPHDDRERGRTDEHTFDVSGEGITTETKLSIRMTSSTDGWLPKSIWAIGQTTEGTFEVLAANPEWSKGAFDLPGLAEHAIN